MPLFSYTTIEENGKKLEGLLHAASEKEAHLLLAERKIFILSLKLLDDAKKQPSLKKKEILAFTSQTAKLLAAGLPLYEALLSLEEKYRSTRLQPFLLDLVEQLKAGHFFSEALRSHAKNFDFLYCAMVANAEKTGRLEQTLEEMAALLEKSEKLKTQLLSALLYPAFLFGFSLLVVFILLFIVLPSLFELFEGRSLHPLTQAILFCSRCALSHKWEIGAFFVVLLSCFPLFFFVRKVKEEAKNFFFRIPFVKGLMLTVGFIRYFRSLSVLLQGGVPLLDALQLSQNVMGYSLLHQQMKEAEKRVGEGWLLSLHLEKSSLVPRWVCRMVAVAEKTGDLHSMLRRIADLYEEELEKSLAQITTFLQPLLLIILGAIVGTIVLSVIIPLTDVSSFAI